MLVVPVVLVVITIAGMSAFSVASLGAASSTSEGLSRDFAMNLVAAERLRSLGEELAQGLTAYRKGALPPETLEPWLANLELRGGISLTQLRRLSSRVEPKMLRSVELALADSFRAARDPGDVQGSQVAHDRLEQALASYVEETTTAFDRSVYDVRHTTSRRELAIVLATIAILAAAISISALAILRLDQLFRREQAATLTARREAAARQEVLAVLAHDLRTPLSTIAMSSAFLADAMSETLESGGPRRRVESIRNASERMLHLIDETLDTARLEAGTINLRLATCDVTEVLDKVLELFQPRASDKQVSLREEPPDPPLTIEADRERLFQIFSNLVANAMRHTPRGGEVVVGATSHSDHVRFAIRDTGSGIPPEQRQHLFDRYWQGPGAGERGTLGLGLFICKRLVEAHGGVIWAEPNPDGGSCFCFTIPIRAIPAAGPHRD